MQQQLNTLIQDNNPEINNPRNNEATTTQSEPRRNNETRRDKEREFNTSIMSLKDAQIAQKG